MRHWGISEIGSTLLGLGGRPRFRWKGHAACRYASNHRREAKRGNHQERWVATKTPGSRQQSRFYTPRLIRSRHSYAGPKLLPCHYAADGQKRKKKAFERKNQTTRPCQDNASVMIFDLFLQNQLHLRAVWNTILRPQVLVVVAFPLSSFS